MPTASMYTLDTRPHQRAGQEAAQRQADAAGGVSTRRPPGSSRALDEGDDGRAGCAATVAQAGVGVRGLGGGGRRTASDRLGGSPAIEPTRAAAKSTVRRTLRD